MGKDGKERKGKERKGEKDRELRELMLCGGVREET